MRVQPKPLNRYPWFIRLFFSKQKKTYGKILDPGLLWGRSGWLFSTLALLYGAVNRGSSPLDPALRSMVTVRVSQINHCAFCVDVNGATLEKRGVCKEKIQLLHGWRDSEKFTPIERASLEYAEAMTYTDRDVSDEVFGELKRFFDDDTIIELTGLVAFQNMSSKFNEALDIPSQGFCQVPKLKMD
jgi:AhpD family alkylhydroperoxidase